MEMVAKLKASRAAKLHALEVLSTKIDRAATEDPKDLLLFEELKTDLAGIDAQIKRLEDGARRAARAVPAVPYDPDHVSRAQPRRNYNLRSFTDEMAAFRAGKFLSATIFGNEGSREYLRNAGINTKALVEGINSAGGALVPDEWAATIINLKEQFGVASRECGKVMMNRDTMQMPRRTGGVTASFVSDGVSIPESTASWDNVQLSAKKMAALVRISTELAEDAMVNVADYITAEIAYAFASKEDDCLFSADGTSTYAGIVGLKNAFATNTAGVYTATGRSTFETLIASDLSGLMGLLPQYALPNAKFYCSQSFFANVFLRLAASAGGNTIQTLSGTLNAYAGKPIVISQKLPNRGDAGLSGSIVAYYGDMSKAVAFGDRRTVTVKRSNERYFDTDQIGIMGTERVDIVVHDVGTTSVTGPLVALKMG